MMLAKITNLYPHIIKSIDLDVEELNQPTHLQTTVATMQIAS